MTPRSPRLIGLALVLGALSALPALARAQESAPTCPGSVELGSLAPQRERIVAWSCSDGVVVAFLRASHSPFADPVAHQALDAHGVGFVIGAAGARHHLEETHARSLELGDGVIIVHAAEGARLVHRDGTVSH